MNRTEKPLEKFESQEQLNEYLEYWKNVLHLQGWIIRARVCPMEDFQEADRAGEISMHQSSRTAAINILDPKEYPDNCIPRYCAEQYLVHELLHCKIDFLIKPETYEGKYLEVGEHRLLDEMADSLLMARYDVTRDWFYNPNLRGFGNLGGIDK